MSRKGDDRQLSPAGQAAECRDRLTDLGHPLGAVHVDDGKSAWNPRVHRAGWDTLMERLETGAAGGVIVFDLARFSRRPIEGERLIAAAERGLLVLDSESSYDLRTPNGKKQFRDHLAGAAYESDRASTRTRRGKRQRALGGEPNGGSRPFGWEADLVTVRESEARVLRDLTARFLAGESQRRLIAWLNEAGITTSWGGTWTWAGLRQLLTRERNCGQIVYKGTVVSRLPGPPVISEDDFGQVLARYASRRRGRPPAGRYLASGTVRCGLCGRKLGGRPRPLMKPYPDGEVRRHYWCVKSNGGCGHVSADQRDLDEAVAELAIAILSDPRHAAAIEDAASARAGRAAELDAAIGEAENLDVLLADRLGSGDMSLAAYDAAAGPLRRRLAALHAERATLGGPRALPVPVPGQWAERWEVATVDERRMLLRLALRGRVIALGPALPGRRGDVRARLSLT